MVVMGSCLASILYRVETGDESFSEGLESTRVHCEQGLLMAFPESDIISWR